MDIEKQLKVLIPTLKTRKKAEVWWWVWILGPLLKVICPEILSRYYTTFGSTVHFPQFETQEAWRVLLHEGRHIQRYLKHRVLYTLGYIFPQVCVLGCLCALIPHVGGWWWLLCAVCALPLPAPWRVKEEIEGYAVTIATYVKPIVTDSRGVFKGFENLEGPVVTPDSKGVLQGLINVDYLFPGLLDSVVPQFTGRYYYFMSWNGADIKYRLQVRVTELIATPDSLINLIPPSSVNQE